MYLLIPSLLIESEKRYPRLVPPRAWSEHSP